ncbi:MAG: hypothetical protein AAF090_18465 [Bacteroidota bacterium]
MTSNLIARFKSHNELGTKGWTIKFRPWEVIHLEVFSYKSILDNFKVLRWLRFRIIHIFQRLVYPLIQPYEKSNYPSLCCPLFSGIFTEKKEIR